MQEIRSKSAARPGYARGLAVVTVAALLTGSAVVAQNSEKTEASVYRTFFLAHATTSNQELEIASVLRNALQRARVVYVSDEKAITFYGTPEDLETAQKIVSDLDKPERTYRITYTMRQMNSGQPAGPAQQVTLVATSGESARWKAGNRVPLVTGTADEKSAPGSTQVQYIDVGLSIEAGVEAAGDDLQLETRLEESEVADEKSSFGAQDPVIRQTSLTSKVSLAAGKPATLGVLDIPGTTRQEQVEVRAEPVEQ